MNGPFLYIQRCMYRTDTYYKVFKPNRQTETNRTIPNKF
jgi:hypothetical protein